MRKMSEKQEKRIEELTNKLKEEREIKLKRELDEIEKQRMRKKAERRVERQIRKEKIVTRIALFLGITTIGGTALLTAGNEEPKQPNGPRIENETDLDTQDDKITFKDGLVVTPEQLMANKEQENPIRKIAEQEINGLETSEEVLDYIKNIFVENYNNKNENDITKEQLELNKSRADKEIYKDTATNGDNILRYKYSAGNNLYNQTGVITVYIDNEGEKNQQQIAKYDKQYQTIYSSNEQVDKYEDNSLVDVAGIIDTGIDWAVAIQQEGNSYETQQEYKNRLIDAITEYRTEKTNENIKLTEQSDELEY